MQDTEFQSEAHLSVRVGAKVLHRALFAGRAGDKCPVLSGHALSNPGISEPGISEPGGAGAVAQGPDGLYRRERAGACRLSDGAPLRGPRLLTAERNPGA